MLMFKLWDAAMLVRLIESEGITTFFAVPTMLVGLLEALDREDRNMASMEVISTGGAPVHRNWYARYANAWAAACSPPTARPRHRR